MPTPYREKNVTDTDPIGTTYEVYGWYSHQEWVQVRSIEDIPSRGRAHGQKLVSVVPVNLVRATRRYVGEVLPDGFLSAYTSQ